ncbi:hypothetical protein H633G_10908 [Metarhizium anisopliae BRIP 53284]|nr:hypothetical protein H633G_10908 [Metarhizium anisopliae BRIP 53284]
MSTHAFNSSQCNDSSVAGPDFSTRHDELLRQNVWLAGICLLNALTFLTIIFRSVARRTTTKQFRIEDYLMMISGALVIFPHWVGQIGWNLWKVDETIFTDPRLIMMRIALFVVFGSSVLGTIICLCRIWTSIYNFRGAEGSIDMIGTDMVLANLEILLYSIGASMSVISKKIISMLSRKASPVGSTESGHAMPDFRIEHNPPRRDRGFLGRNTPKTELPKKDPRSDPKYQMSDSTVVWDSLDKMKDSRFPI